MKFERPKLERVFRRLNLHFDRVVDVGAEVGASAELFREFGAVEVIGYEVDRNACKAADLSKFTNYFCRAMTLAEYLDYVRDGWFIKMDCEGCEADYITKALPERGLISLHDWVFRHMEFAETLQNNGFMPVFHSYDWREITYLKC